MAGITLWGRKSSSNVQKVVWVLAEVGLNYRHIQVGGRFGGLDTEQYRDLNPNRLVPVLRDGDLTLWESHAIVRYVAARYAAGTLFPTDPVERAIVDQWTDWTATTFQPAWIGLFWSAYRTRLENRDTSAIARAVAAAHRAFAIIEERLSGVPYLAGPALTYADIVAGVALFRWFGMDIERPDLPAVSAWHARLRERQAFVAAVEVDFSELANTL